ncbi:MAG: DUF58 domain-containing protein, partial [Planctomycetes bacterium]|nr:DUF58 domain-containing protein [Planctomycetota bacterium]
MNELSQWAADFSTWAVRLTWLLVLLYTAPLLVLGYKGRIFPHLPLVILLAGPCVLSILLPWWPSLFVVVAALDLALLAAGAIDLATLPGKKSFSAERQTTRIASLGQKHRVTLTVSNLGRRGHNLWIRDDTPQDFEALPEEFHINLNGRSRAVLHYEAKPVRRGAFTLESIYLRVRSRFGLWRRHLTYPARTVIHVYPDMKQLSEFAVLARTNRLSLMGVRRTRRVGQDNEFERLRDYTRDDNYRHIDWRTTARRSKLTVKDFQTSQSQRLMFLIDCGRMMTNEAAGLSLLDHAFNAMLMLSFVALRQGDSVGLTCFSDRIHSFTPPRGGMKQMNHLLHASFDRFPHLVESRYDEAFLHLAAHCRKRALVILITNVIDEVNSHQVERYLGTLVGRHLPLGVLLRDHHLF